MNEFTSEQIDYRFGWRWLIPHNADGQFAAVGLAASEIDWWCSQYPRQIFTDDLDAAQAWLVALDGNSIEMLLPKINGANTQWIAVWGRGHQVEELLGKLRGFESVREYALLPEDNSRVVVPLSSSVNAEMGLSLHRPGRWLARIVISVARCLAHFKCFFLLRRRVLVIATRSINYASELLSNKGLPEFVDKNTDFTLYFGTADENRKTIVLPLLDGNSQWVLKTAQLSRAKDSVRREASVLRALAASIVASQVPDVKWFVEIEGAVTLCQEYRSRRWSSRMNIIAATNLFLSQLAKIDQKEVWLGDVIEELVPDLCRLPVEVQRACNALNGNLHRKAQSGEQIVVHRGHGDFAPWNSFWTEKGFFVFDWEDSSVDKWALDDGIYYILAPYSCIHKCDDLNRLYLKARNFVGPLMSQLGISQSRFDIYFYLSVLSRMNKTEFFGRLAIFLASKVCQLEEL